MNLSSQMDKQLPTELVEFMQTSGLIAASQGMKLYLVGGVVRDLLLKRANFDLDLVVEGNAIELAQRLAEFMPCRFTTHRRFNTANLRWQKWSIDLVMARSETYDKPGALPRVKPGTLASDLFRRDFTINTMAIKLSPDRYGHLIDLYEGMDDLEQGLIRVLHDNSFIDDSTRIWRGLRYEQRLDFQLEPSTRQLLIRDIPMLDMVSGDRLRHELELILAEDFPEKVIGRAYELGALTKLHPSLKSDGWLAEKFKQARLFKQSLPGLYTALLAYRLTGDEIEGLISRLRFRKSLAQVLRETSRLKNNIGALLDTSLKPSRTYEILQEYSPAAITAVSIATESEVAREHIQTYLTRLRYIKPALTGNDLQKMGIAPGPKLKETLLKLLEARLDSKVKSREDEEEMVRGWVL